MKELPKICTTIQAAQHLNRSVRTMYSWAKKGTGPITPVLIGRRLAWRLDEIEALLNNRVRPGFKPMRQIDIEEVIGAGEIKPAAAPASDVTTAGIG